MLRAPKAVDSILAKKINHPFETAPQTPQTTSNVYSERYMLRDNDKPSQESLMPFGNQTWQLTSPVHGGFNGKRINKWGIFQPAAIDCRMVYPIVMEFVQKTKEQQKHDSYALSHRFSPAHLFWNTGPGPHVDRPMKSENTLKYNWYRLPKFGVIRLYIHMYIYIYIAYRIVYIYVFYLFSYLFIYTCFFLMYLYLSNTLDSCVWVIEAFSKKNTSTAEPPTLAIPWRRCSGKRCDLQEISGEDLQSGRRCVGWGLIYWFLALGISFVGILEGLLYLLGNSWEGASLIGVVLFDKKG